MISPATPQETAAFLAEARALTDAALDRWLPQIESGSHAAHLAEAMRYSIEAGGKRLRPALALAGCRALGGEDDQVLPFACALELVHTYSLIHDDLPAMDDDDLRRGRPTSHKVFGEALAILAGDALHTHAFEVLLRHTPDAARARALGSELATAAGFDGMVGGQADDLASGGEVPDVAHLEGIHRRKTGALLGAAVRGGGIAAGGTPEHVDALGTFGMALGLAFQITDDILDVTGTASALGKTPGKDAREHKMTYVSLDGIEGAKARAAHEIERAMEALEPLTDAALLAGVAQFVLDRDR